jgi:hypothetical protein
MATPGKYPPSFSTLPLLPFLSARPCGTSWLHFGSSYPWFSSPMVRTFLSMLMTPALSQSRHLCEYPNFDPRAGRRNDGVLVCLRVVVLFPSWSDSSLYNQACGGMRWLNQTNQSVSLTFNGQCFYFVLLEHPGANSAQAPGSPSIFFRIRSDASPRSPSTGGMYSKPSPTIKTPSSSQVFATLSRGLRIHSVRDNTLSPSRRWTPTLALQRLQGG